MANDTELGLAAYFTVAALAHLAPHWGSKYGIEEFLEVKHLCMRHRSLT